MNTSGKTAIGLIVSIFLIAAGIVLISQARREHMETVRIIDPAVYSSGPEEQMIAGTHNAETEIRIVTETNYFYLAAGIGLIVLAGVCWLFRLAGGGKNRNRERQDGF